jgi:two-component system, OmpR family, sensor histidine kinase CiaH
MSVSTKIKLRRAIIVYWVLLAYIITALFWWFVSLEKQSETMLEFRIHQLDASLDKSIHPNLYQQEYNRLQNIRKRDSTKYIGEGVIFLLLIILGAVFVYRSVRNQIRFQNQQQNFMMAVTHELKTPISVAKLNLETILKHDLDTEKRNKLLRMTLQETTRLNALTNNILVSSQLDAEGYKPSAEELNFSDLTRDRITDFRNRYPDREFEDEILEDVELEGDAFLLQMLINNLLENALKYSPKDKTVTCTLTVDKNKAILSIKDEGAGIPENERSKVFEKFYRIGSEATRKAQGTGLGLYLCERIALWHNANITVTDNIPNGSNFAVTFTHTNASNT